MLMHEFWSICLNWFEQELPAQQFNTWIKGLRLEIDPKNNTQYQLIAPNRFIMQWVRERYLTQIEALGNDFFAHPITIQLSVTEPIPESSLPNPELEDNHEIPKKITKKTAPSEKNGE